MMSKKCSKWLLNFTIFLTVISPLTACAKNPHEYTNPEFGFGLQYPESWVVRPSLVPNSRIRVVAPTGALRAECMVVVKRYAKAVSAQQSDIDQVFLEKPSVSELKDILSQSAQGVDVQSASSGKLHARPAHLALVRYTMDSPTGTTFVSGRVLMTATPGLTWTLSCGGQGSTAAEAEKSFQFWRRDIDSTVTSFTFK